MRSDIFSLGAVLYHVLSYGEEVFGDDEHKYIYNVNNNIMDTSRLLVTNPKTTEHLIKLMLHNERCRRPAICEVADHPCWKGTEIECCFGEFIMFSLTNRLKLYIRCLFVCVVMALIPALVLCARS